MCPSEDEAEASERERAFALTSEEERKLLREILEKGWELGCFLTDEQAGQVLTDSETRAWLEKMEERPRQPRDYGGRDNHPKGLDHSDPSADEGWLVLVNRCDLLADLAREPLIELVRCRKVKGQTLMEATKNSSRFVLVWRPEGAKHGWMVDLRRTASIPKTRLAQFGEPVQILPDDRAFRNHFALRAGRRVSRPPLPEIFVPLQEALRALIEAEYLDETAEFHGWMICEDAGRSMPVVVALISATADLVAADDTFEKILTALDATAHEVVDIDGSRVERLNEVRLDQYMASYVVDVRDITYGVEQKLLKAQKSGKPAPVKKHVPPAP